MLPQRIRPYTLDEFVGNANAVKTLRSLAASDDPPHCFLFSGPSGCGKTTLARISARNFGAVESVSLVEINAASERGIDIARDLGRFSESPPLVGGSWGIIIDEAHQLTKDAQSCLLKTLEDTPKFTFFFLCTTEPARLLPTISTRCQKIEVFKLDADDLLDVCLRGIEVGGVLIPNEEVLDAIVENADGCPREALNMLEKQNGFEKEEALEIVASHRTSEKVLIDLCRTVIQGTWREVVKTYAEINDKNTEGIRYCLLGYLKSCLLKAKVPNEASKWASMIEELTEPTYSSGEPGLIAMMFRANERR